MINSSDWIEFNYPWCVRVDNEPELPGCPEFPKEIIERDALEQLGFNSEKVKELRKLMPPPDENYDYDDNDVNVINYREHNFKLREFEHDHPLTIEFEKELREWHIKNQEFKQNWYKENNPSFCALGLDEAGTLIQFRQFNEGTGEFGESVIEYLIGHINRSGGICDDCKGIEDKDIVLRYKVIWSNRDEK